MNPLQKPLENHDFMRVRNSLPGSALKEADRCDMRTSDIAPREAKRSFGTR
jgi:hypothetical protein